MKQDLLDWLSVSELNVFATISLKQAMENERGGWSRINREQVTRTAWLLRDRFTKAIVGKRKKLPFIVFVEGDAVVKRKHLHIATTLPDGMSIAQFSDVFRFQALKLDWVYNEIDIRPIEEDTYRRVVAYSLKEGADAFIPEASFVPFMN